MNTTYPRYDYPRYRYDYPVYRYPFEKYHVRWVEPTFYGTCAAANGQIVVNQCLRGTMATPVGANGCTCYDPATQWFGCENTANAVCKLPVWSL